MQHAEDKKSNQQWFNQFKYPFKQRMGRILSKTADFYHEESIPGTNAQVTVFKDNPGIHIQAVLEADTEERRWVIETIDNQELLFIEGISFASKIFEEEKT